MYTSLLSVPLRFLFNRRRFLLIAGSNLKNSLTKSQSPHLSTPENSFFLRKLTGFVPHFSIFNRTLSCTICSSLHLSLMLSSKFSLGSTAPFGHPSSNFFIHSLSLYEFCTRHNSRRRSLFMLVLSHSDTHFINRHMVGCGCHERGVQSRSSQECMVWCECPEILIQRCITVLFLSHFSRYPTQLWFWWLSYLNHSFQLVSIHYSVHQSDPPRIHQSCYQELFISTSDRRQGHLQRNISCCRSNKACEFIASTVYKIHSLTKPKTLTAPKR